jgi:hypothetical protein
MRSRYLLAKFHEHLARKAAEGKIEALAPGAPVMVVFGTDQARLDHRKGAVVLPQFGEIPAPDLKGAKRRPLDWFGILNESGEFSLVLGVGNPYQSDIPAVPYSAHDAA